MPAPAVYILAVVGTLGAAFAFHHFVYEPHLAPKIEQWAEEYVARRRARRMQQQGPILVPASIPLRRRRGSHSGESDSTLSDSDSRGNSNHLGPSSGHGNTNSSSGISRNGPSSEFDGLLASEVSEWRSKVEQNRTASGLRHRTNINAHVMDESISSIPQATMSPTHVIIDTSAPTTPSTITIPSRLPSPPPQVSPLQSMNSDITSRPSNSGRDPLSGPSPLSQARTLPSVLPRGTMAQPNSTQNVNISPSYSPPTFSSPIPSLSQAYPQELDREQGVELLSPPSSGTSSPFSTFSPFVAPQALSPFTVVQSIDHPASPGIPSPPGAISRTLSPSRHTVTSSTQSNYQSLPTSPEVGSLNLSSPVNVSQQPLRSPSPPGDLSYLSSPSPINFVSPPSALSPRSPPSDLSELEFGSDIEVLSDPGSDGSDRSWAGISDAGSRAR